MDRYKKLVKKEFKEQGKITELVLDGIRWKLKKNGKYRCPYLKRNKCTVFGKPERPNLCILFECADYIKNKGCKGCKNICCDDMRLQFQYDGDKVKYYMIRDTNKKKEK